MYSVPPCARMPELRLHRTRVSQRDIGRSATPWRGCAAVSIRGRRATWGNDGASLRLPRRGCGLNPKPTVHPTRSRVCERACAVRPGTRTSRDAFLAPRWTSSGSAIRIHHSSFRIHHSAPQSIDRKTGPAPSSVTVGEIGGHDPSHKRTQRPQKAATFILSRTLRSFAAKRHFQGSQE